jgi:membrane protein implicated in regulation of membrane protease activity
MCHLLLLMPLVALPLFWFLPMTAAASIYTGVVALSAWLYVYVFKAWSRPVVTGKEYIINSTGEVMDAQGHTLHVRVHSEIWSAESSDTLQPGDRIKVTGIESLTLKVEKAPQN